MLRPTIRGVMAFVKTSACHLGGVTSLAIGSERFGMVVLEAMSTGCVPVVANKGALPEFVKHGKNGFLFDDLEGLEKWTVKLIKDEELRKKLSKEAVATAKKFDKRVFEKRLKRIVREKLEEDRGK